MRKTFGKETNYSYWRERWHASPADLSPVSENHYPVNFALQTISMGTGKKTVLEAGCGPGRLYRRLKSEDGVEVFGFDFVPEVVDKLKKTGLANLEVMDARELKYESNYFSHVLAFGLLHNFAESDMMAAIHEIKRVMSPGAFMCASFRLQSAANLLTDTINGRSFSDKPRRSEEGLSLHKISYKKIEIELVLLAAGFELVEVQTTSNMPLAYKYRIFRHSKHKKFSEARGRNEGYRLNKLGKTVYYLLDKLLGDHNRQLIVVIAKKPIN